MDRTIVVLLFLFVVAFHSVSQNIGDNIKYIPVDPGKNINTPYNETSPIISPDGRSLYFVRADHPQNRFKSQGSQDIWLSEKQADGTWGPAKHLPGPLNEHHGNQIFTVLPDNQTVFARGGVASDTKGFCLFKQEYGVWVLLYEIKVDRFKEMDKGTFYGASMSSDREHLILYFSEDAALARNDLYYSKRLDSARYSRPVKISGSINTPMDEFAPFIGADNKTLFFASTRREGSLGKSDLYMSTRLDNSWLKWSDPIALPAPINTEDFDGHVTTDSLGTYYIVKEGNQNGVDNLDINTIIAQKLKIIVEGLVTDRVHGDSLYAPVKITRNKQLAVEGSSWKIPGKYSLALPGPGDYTISLKKEGYFPADTSFSFKNIENDTLIRFDFSLKPEYEFVAVWGMVYNAKTLEPVPNASVNIQALSNRKVEINHTTDLGYYEKMVNGKGDYLISATADGFMDDNVQTRVTGEKPFHRGHVFLVPIEVGASVVLKNLYFEIGTTELTEDSFFELDKVVTFLNKNTTIVVEISGHTDDMGSSEYNLNLSQGRSESVVEYLVGKGIPVERMVAKGYGEERPIADNEAYGGKAKNRRVEFKIIAK